MMRRLLRVSDRPKQKVDLNYRLGKIFDEQMKEPEPAEEYLVEALSQDPAHVPSMLSLLGIYKRRGDWHEGGAADGPRRGQHRQPAGEDAAAVRGRARSTRTSSATRRRPRTCTRA